MGSWAGCVAPRLWCSAGVTAGAAGAAREVGFQRPLEELVRPAAPRCGRSAFSRCVLPFVTAVLIFVFTSACPGGCS